MKKFKNAIVGSIVAVILYAGSIFAGDITGTGHYWADMYTYLTNVKTMSNELKTDHNALYANYTGAANLANEIKTDHNAVFASYTGLENMVAELKTDYNLAFTTITSYQTRFNNFTSFAEMKAYNFGRYGTTAIAATSKAAAAGDATSTAAATETAAATSTSDLSLTGL